MNTIDAMYEVCNRLLKWNAIQNLGVSDILVDPSTYTVALWGDALKLELKALKQPVWNQDFRLNTEFAGIFNIPIEVEKWERSYSVRSTKPMWFHDSGRGGEGGAHISQFLDELGNAIKDAIDAIGGDMSEEEIQATIIPSPGYPYTKGKTTEVYSAKKKKVAKVSTPPWAILVEAPRQADSDEKKVFAVDFCQLLPTVCPANDVGIVGKFERWGGEDSIDFVVTHSSPMAAGRKKLIAEAETKMAKCPGMLFPSLAVGHIPATNFGETVIVGRPGVPLSAMKPYKSRGVWSVTTYDTDVWTETGGEIVNEIAIETYRQLTGHEHYTYSDHLFILGPTIKSEGFGGEDVKPITSTSKLAAILKRKAKKWARNISRKQFDALSQLTTGERYGYLETKSNSILSWDCFPLAVCPAQFAERVHSGLKEIGFKGQLITVEISKEMADVVLGQSKLPSADWDWIQYQYSWLVRDAIIEYAKTQNAGFFNVQEG